MSSIQSLSIAVPVNPLDLLVNNRFRNSHAIPKKTREAMKQVQQTARDLTLIHGFSPTKGSFYRIDLSLYMSSMRGDIDGPAKRIVDSIFRGIREAVDETWINDGRIVTLTIDKWWPNEVPSIHALITCVTGTRSV